MKVKFQTVGERLLNLLLSFAVEAVDSFYR